MFRYIWVVMLTGLYLIWTIRSIVDGIQWFLFQKKWGSDYNDYGGWAMVWLGLHLVALFAFSFNAYHMTS